MNPFSLDDGRIIEYGRKLNILGEGDEFIQVKINRAIVYRRHADRLHIRKEILLRNGIALLHDVVLIQGRPAMFGPFCQFLIKVSSIVDMVSDEDDIGPVDEG